MRKTALYLKIFAIPILLFIICALTWLFAPDSVSSTQGGLLGAVLGVGLSISVAESFKALTEHKRRKKTFGLLKLITIPYLKCRASGLIDTMKDYNDICSFEKAVEFLVMVSHFDSSAQSFDKEWFQLVYSQDFLDAIKSDTHFGALAIPIKEVLLMSDQLTTQATNAKVNLSNDLSNLTDDNKNELIRRSRQMRDVVMDNALKLQKYTDDLDKELMTYLQQNGVGYSETDR